MSAFEPVLALGELWDGEPQACELHGRRVLLVRVGDAVRAYEDRCPHLGARLSRGCQQAHVLTCSVHQWQFDLRTGAGINPADACLRAVPVEIRNGQICIDVPEPEAVREPC